MSNSFIRWSNHVAETPGLCNSVVVASHKNTKTRERQDKSESVNTN